MSPGAHATGTPDDGFGRLASPATSTGDEHASRSDVETGRSDARRSAVHAEAPARGTRRLAVASGSVALVVMVAVGSAVVMGGQQRPVAPESKQAAGAGSSLELMSLDSARDGDRVTIRGLVKNPLTGHRVDGLQAVAFLFDRRGQYIGATSAVVAQGALAPGAESPFEVPLAAGGLQVGRYRLSFRVADTPVPHVDRRSDVAGNPEPAR
ncbi:MAG: FxLYD domain-containing protein [Acidobacteriota bacterium]